MTNQVQHVARGEFTLPDTKLPTGAQTLQVIDSGDQKAVFWKQFFAAYEKKHPEVEINYKAMNWPDIDQSMTLGLRNGTVPDVFFLPTTVTTGQAVSEKWVGAWDDIVDDWAEIKKRFPAGTFVTGKTDFEGKTYAFPLTSAQRFNSLMFYNKEIIQRAEADLSEPITWDSFRALLKKITQQGEGKYYGTIMGLQQSGAGPSSVMAQMAGVHGGITGTNWLTGEFNYTDPISIEAVEFLLAIYADGSIAPGSVSYKDQDARGRFPQGQAGMIIHGPWNLSPWRDQNPDFGFDFTIPPQRNPKEIWPVGYAPGGSNAYFYNPNTKVGEVVADVISYLGSTDGQAQWASIDGAADPAAFPDAIAKADLTELDSKAMEINSQYSVLAPEPSVRNPQVERVYEVQKPLQPDLGDVCLGLITKQIKSSVKDAMADLQDRANRSLDEAIATANKRGAKVSREDWVFSDWDPKKPYDKPFAK
ncbi:ABC transporter substrate-binding protein [Microlunatus soli]|nr:extracellular solute-binding protein [Microlunatus soli]